MTGVPAEREPGTAKSEKNQAKALMSLRVMNLDVASVSAGAEIETYLELAIRYKCR